MYTIYSDYDSIPGYELYPAESWYDVQYLFNQLVEYLLIQDKRVKIRLLETPYFIKLEMNGRTRNVCPKIKDFHPNIEVLESFFN